MRSRVAKAILLAALVVGWRGLFLGKKPSSIVDGAIITVGCNYISIVVKNSLVQSTWNSWRDTLGSSKEVIPFKQREKFCVFLNEVCSFKVDSYENLNCSSEWLTTAARSIRAKHVTGDQEVHCVSNKTESSNQICCHSGETEAGGYVCKSDIDCFLEKTYSPIVN